MTTQLPGSEQQLQLIWLWFAIGVCMLAAVAYVSLMPAPEIGVSDKLAHLLTYFLLTGWFALLARSRIALGWTLVALIAYGMVLELLQGQTGYRFAEWGDVIANSVGCLAGGMLYFTPLRRLLRFVDAILASGLRH